MSKKVDEKTARSTYGAANPWIRTGASGGTTGVGQKRGPNGGFPVPDPPSEEGPDDDDFKSTLGIHADNEAVEPQEHDGLFIGLKIPPAIGKLIALPDGEPLDKLHVTLVYTKAGTPDQRREAARIASDLFKRYLPLKDALLGGLGRFSASESSDGKDVLYVSVDSPPLTELRSVLVSELEEIGIRADVTHGYSPHVTIKYIDPNDPLPVKRLKPTPVAFEELVIDGVPTNEGIVVLKRDKPKDLGQAAKALDVLDKIKTGIMADLVTQTMPPKNDVSEDLSEDLPPLIQPRAKSRANPRVAASVLEDFADALVNRGYYISSDDKVLGTGTQGVAFLMGDGNVLKVTQDETEARASQNIKKKKLKHIVNIYDVFQLGDSGWFGICQEKLTPVTSAEGKKFHDAIIHFESCVGDENYDMPWEQLKSEAVRIATKDNTLERTQTAIQTLESFQFPDIIGELADQEIEFMDYHGGNLCKRGTDYVLIDLGYSKSPPLQVPRIEGIIQGIAQSLTEDDTNQSATTDTAKGTTGTKPPPLPKKAEPTDDSQDFSGKVIDETLGKKILDQYRELMRSKRNLDVPPNPRALGTGTHGTAFDLGDKVLKLTSDPAEAKSAQKIVGVKTKFICKIYDVFEFRKTGAYGIVQEKLQALTGKEQQQLGDALAATKVYAFLQKNNFDWDQTQKAMVKAIHQVLEKLRGEGKDVDKAYERFSERWAVLKKFKIGEMAQELKANGIDFFDYHSQNIMRRPGGDYVILDLGHESRVQGGGKTPDVLETLVRTMVQELSEAPQATRADSPGRKARPSPASWPDGSGASGSDHTASRGSVSYSNSPLTKAGGDAYVDKIIQMNAAPLAKKGINVHNLKRLGNGMDGIAYDVGNGKVLKVTVDADEANTDHGLKGKSLHHVVKIFDVWRFKVPDGSKEIFGVLEEKLVPLSEQEKKEFEDATDFFNEEMTPHAKEFKSALRSGNWNEFVKVLKRVIAEEKRSEWDRAWDQEAFDILVDRTVEKHLEILEKFKLKEMMTELRSNRVEFTDYHGGNVMKRGGNYVINDLGRSGAERSGAIPVLEKLVRSVVQALLEEPSATGGSMWGGAGSAGAGAGVKAQSSSWSSPSGLASRKDPNDPEEDDDHDEGLWQLTLMRKDNNMQKVTHGHAEEIDPDEGKKGAP
ncbi:MAG: 2'-5' RNA ligase family protein [Acidiferrobacterales bacterium]